MDSSNTDDVFTSATERSTPPSERDDEVAFEFQLVEYVKNAPFIYNKDMREHHDRQMRINFFSSVAQKLSRPGAMLSWQTVEKRWTNLRRQYSHHRKKSERTRSGSSARKKREWYLLDAMSFLRDHWRERPTVSNVAVHSTSTDADPSLGSPQSGSSIDLTRRGLNSEGCGSPYNDASDLSAVGSAKIDASGSDGRHTTVSSSISSRAEHSTSAMPTIRPAKKRSHDGADAAIVDYVDYMKKNVAKLLVDKDADENQCFGSWVAKELSNMNPLERFQAIRGIQRVIADVQYNRLMHVENSLPTGITNSGIWIDTSQLDPTSDSPGTSRFNAFSGSYTHSPAEATYLPPAERNSRPD